MDWTVSLMVWMVLLVIMLGDITLSVTLGRKRAKDSKPWDTISWAYFICPRCGSKPSQFCRIRGVKKLPRWVNFMKFGTRFYAHKERYAKAMLVLDGNPDNAYKGYKTDVEVLDESES
jgi:hypothetical protein